MEKNLSLIELSRVLRTWNWMLMSLFGLIDNLVDLLNQGGGGSAGIAARIINHLHGMIGQSCIEFGGSDVGNIKLVLLKILLVSFEPYLCQ